MRGGSRDLESVAVRGGLSAVHAGRPRDAVVSLQRLLRAGTWWNFVLPYRLRLRVVSCASAAFGHRVAALVHVLPGPLLSVDSWMTTLRADPRDALPYD